MVYVPTFTIKIYKNQPNVGKYTSPMDAMASGFLPSLKLSNLQVRNLLLQGGRRVPFVISRGSNIGNRHCNFAKLPYF